MEVKTEADDNDITECLHDDKPTVGMFCFSAFIHLFLCCFLRIVFTTWSHFLVSGILINFLLVVLLFYVCA